MPHKNQKKPQFAKRKSLLFLQAGVFALILFVTLAAAIALIQWRQTQGARMLETSQNLVRLFDKSLEGLINTIDVGLLLASKEIGQQLDRGESKSKPINNLLALLDKRIESVAHFRASNEHGHLIYGNTVETHPVNISDREYFIKLKNDPNAGLVITKPLMGRAAKEWVWGFVRRINKPDGSFGGVVLAAVSVDEVRQIFGQLKLGPYGIMALRDSGFSLVSDYPKGMHKIGMTKLHKPFAKAYAATPCIGSYVKGKDGIDGVERTFSYRCSKKYGYNVNVGVSHEAMLAGWKKGVWITVSLIAALTLASIWFLVLVTRAWRKQEASLTTLRNSEEQLADAQNYARLGHWTRFKDGRLLCSKQVYDIYGIPKGSSDINKSLSEVIRPDDLSAIMQSIEESFADGTEHSATFKINRLDSGEARWIHCRGRPVTDDDGNIEKVVGVIQDITDLKQTKLALQESETRLEEVARQSRTFVWEIDANGLYTYISDVVQNVLGYSPEELIGKKHYYDLHPKEGREDLIRTASEVFARKERFVDFHNQANSKEGALVWLSSTASPILDEGGSLIGYRGSDREITEYKRKEEEVNHLAFHDQLTGLANRTLLRDRLKQAMKSNRRSGSYGALLLLDLDNFKTLNDTLGHDSGDLLLQQLARRLESSLREGDTVARLGGDEFVMVIQGLSRNQNEAASQAEAIAEKISAATAHAFLLKGTSYSITPSIGITLFHKRSVNPDIKIKQADLAMYKAKDFGRNNICFFDPEMEHAVIKRANLESNLREAITKEEFTLFYQPQVSNETIFGAEALLRWQHPISGMVSPGEFIPLAEQTGLILPLGNWVLETACRQLAKWAAQPEMAHLSISVNVSAVQFSQSDFVDQVFNLLEKTGANGELLRLELTESTLASNVGDVIEKMYELKAKGVGFALDDFGTGYSSLAYLKRLPLDQLKIDQSFVRDVLTDPNDASIVRTIITLAENLGIGVIAEGVETPGQRDFLAALGCHAYQGYFFSRPLPVGDFEKYAIQRLLSSK